MTSKEVRPTILKDTTLCMIVRDEKMNPAGGIERFAAAHIPHVEEAVIVDTGSVDGTREILERLESQYPNLRVLDRPFDGYSNSRNFSLDQSRTKYNLVLDADELLTEKSPTNDWEDLKEIMEEVDIEMTAFLGLDILADGREHRYSSCPALRRLFLNERKYRYLGEVWERIPADFGLFLPIELKHFRPTLGGSENKHSSWDDGITQHIRQGRAPAQTNDSDSWKEYNFERDKFI